MTGAGCRSKGHAWEREVAGVLRSVFKGAKRGLSQTRDGSDVPDVDGTPFWIECKVGRRTNPRAALQQAGLASLEFHESALDAPLRPPVAVCKDDRAEPFVTMALADWMVLVEKAYGSRAEQAERSLATRTPRPEDALTVILRGPRPARVRRALVDLTQEVEDLLRERGE